MSNQSQPRPLFRLGSIARPVLPQVPPPAPGSASRPQMQPPAALLPRPTMLRPTFRPPIFSQLQSSQDSAPPLQPPGPRAPPPTTPSVSPPSVAPPPSSPPVAVSPSVSPPKPLPRIASRPPLLLQDSAPSSPATRRSPSESLSTPKSPLASPVSQKSHHASPMIQKTPPASSVTQTYPPASPVTSKYPSTPGEQQISSTNPLPSTLPSPFKPRTQTPPSSVSSSPVMKQDVSQSVPLPPPKSVSPMPSPMPSPRAAKPLPETPPESPKIKPELHSPPSFSLPPSQLKSDGDFERKIPAIAEQKKVLHVGKPRSVLNPHGDNSEKSKEQESKRVSDTENVGMRVVTISGENKGAIMELSYSPKTHGNPYKLRSDGELSEGNLNKNHNANAKDTRPMHAFMNSNVQGINSSIVLNSTLSHHDPGVHLSLTRNPGKGHLKGHTNGYNVLQKESGYRFSD